MEAAELDGIIDGYRDSIIKLMSNIIKIKSVSPEAGGEGEGLRADFLEKEISATGVECKRYNYTDSHGVQRPNIVCRIGEHARTLWIVAHMDTVSEGDITLWKTDPFKAYVSKDRIYGRGTDDNGQGIVSAIFALKALQRSGIGLRYNFGIALVADEELGSRYGIQKLLDEKIFDSSDLFLVPDWGNSRGDEIEIAEKGMLWLRFKVTGKQAHASVPEEGVNAYRYSSQLVLELDNALHRKYSRKDSIFEPSSSTFEMTKHEKNVDSINIVPGTDIFYIDCRVLPCYRLDDVIKDVVKISKSKAFRDVKVDVEVFNREDPAPQLDADSEVVALLEKAISSSRGIIPSKVGIGGGTCAAFFRKRGMQAVVWATLSGMAHQPNEYARIDNIIEDAKIFARMALG